MCDHHGHDEGANVFVFGVRCDGSDQAYAGGIAQGDVDLGAGKVGENLGKEYGFESHFNGRTVVLAGDAFLGGNAEFDVLCRNEYLVCREEQLDQVGGLVGADAYAANGVHQFYAVSYDVVGVVLWDYAPVGRVVAFHKTADHAEGTEGKEGVGLVVGNGDVFFNLDKQVLEYVCRFFGKDER